MIPASGNGRVIGGCFIAACCAALAAELVAVAGLAPAPHRFLSLNPNAHHAFFAFAMGGMFAIHAIAGTSRQAVVRASLLGFVLLALHGVLLGIDSHRLDHLLGFLVYYQGVGSTLVLAGSAVANRRSAAGKSALLLLVAGSVMPIVVLASYTFLTLSRLASPLTLDAVVFHFDRSLGFHPSAAVANVVLGSEPILQFFLAVYAALPLMIAAACGIQLSRRAASANVLLVFMAIAVVGFPLYYLYPVTGPIYAFGAAFFAHVPELADVPLVPLAVAAVPRNGMPSLHFAWTVALWLGALHMAPVIRRGFAVFAVLTAVATLGLGEHYLIDLVVALPLAVAVHAMFVSGDGGARRQAFGCGLLVLAAWLFYLMFGREVFATVGLAHWLPIGLTLIGTVWFGYRLAR